MRFSIFTAALGIFGLAAIHGMYAGTPHEPVSRHEPVYMSWKDLRAAIKSEAAKPIGKRGKIGLRGNLLFINEPNLGIHVFDNGDPAQPKPLAFLKIPGNVDLAVKGDVLFVDSFVDLVALDISALPAVKELNRQVDVFPYDAFQAAEQGVWYGGEIDKTKGVVIRWKEAG
jgi:hypothetical protein